MRTTFEVPPVDEPRFVREALVVPDTNVLLGLYRLSPAAQAAALDALAATHGRLWLPHQVGQEFYRNVDAVRGELREAYDGAVRALADVRKSTSALFGSGQRHHDSRAGVRGQSTPRWRR